MSAVRDDETFRRAGRIVAGSRVAALVERIFCRSVAGVRTSRWLAAARHRVEESQAVPADERHWSGVLLVAAALAGHIVMAPMLPWPARPTLTVTALTLLAAGLAAGAMAARKP